MEDEAFALDARQAADAAADRAAGAEAFGLGHFGEAGILERLARGVYAEDDEGIDLALDLVIDALAGVEAPGVIGGLDLARDGAFLVRRVEAGDRACARFARDQVRPAGFDIAAERGDQPEAGNDNAAHGRGGLSPCWFR